MATCRPQSFFISDHMLCPAVLSSYEKILSLPLQITIEEVFAFISDMLYTLLERSV